MYTPWVPNCMQNLKGDWKFLFPKMFNFYRDLFLSNENITYELICQMGDSAPN